MSNVFYSWASLVAQLVKNPPAVLETWVRSLGWEDPLEKGTATHAGILAWRIPWTVLSMVSKRVGHDWATFTILSLSNFVFFFFNRRWSSVLSKRRWKWTGAVIKQRQPWSARLRITSSFKVSPENSFSACALCSHFCMWGCPEPNFPLVGSKWSLRMTECEWRGGPSLSSSFFTISAFFKLCVEMNCFLKLSPR